MRNKITRIWRELKVERQISESHQHIDNIMSCGVGQKNPGRPKKILIRHKMQKMLIKIRSLEPIANRKIIGV